jgi:hypothetical protein
VSASVTDRARTSGRARTTAVPVPREAGPGGAAPAKERKRGAPRTATPRAGSQRTQVGADRAYARRDERLRRLVGGARPQRTAAPTGRAKFVLLIMSLLVGGLVATLWLSTAASADSYRLQDAKAALTTLTQQDESLHREVAQLASAPELARQAEALGMVRVEDPARLVVAPDGSVTVVGKPQAAPAPPPPPAPTAPAAGAEVGGSPVVPGAPTDPAQINPAQGDPTQPLVPTDPAQQPADGDQDGTAPRDPAQQASAPGTATTPPAATGGTTAPGSGTGTAGSPAGGGTD